MKTDTALPRWDMTPIYPALDSPEFEADFASVIEAIASLRAAFDRAGVRAGSSSPDSFDEIVSAYNALLERVRTLNAYIESFVATDTRNELAQAKGSELQEHGVELSKLGTRLVAWIGSLDVGALFARSELARAHEYVVRKSVDAARKQMSEAEEDLAASLFPSGEGAWSKLHGDITSRLAVTVPKPDGTSETMPMSRCRGLAHDPDPALREAAYRAEITGWESVAVPLAAAMNSIKGGVNVLNARRGWEDSLAPALFANNVDRETLEAMQAACVEAFPDFRRYLRAKAAFLGKDALDWWDLFAPVQRGGSRQWDYRDATSFVVDRFGTYSGRLAGLAGRAFAEQWVDAEPREGKVDGAFCMGVRTDESRVMMNFEPSFNSVSTLAHELGHAYHNLNLHGRTPMQRRTPMALAETASIFCETIVVNSMLSCASDAEKLSILENDLQGTCQIVVDIHSRFLFERAVFTGRARRELSVSELCDAMRAAQRQAYGDGLATVHEYMWAMKPHYYGANYYNWPYTFGLLFGLGLYALYRKDADGFRAGYDELLSSTGMHDAATLAARFGFDVRDVAFWRGSLDQIRARVAEFEGLTTP